MKFAIRQAAAKSRKNERIQSYLAGMILRELETPMGAVPA